VIEIDATGFDRYAGDLAAAAREVAAGIPGVVKNGAGNVKKDWNAAFWASTYFKGAGGSVNYDVTTGPGFIEAEIGPDLERFPGQPGPGRKSPAAGMANIAHFGGANGGGGTVADPQEFLDREAPAFEKYLTQLIEQALT
jgi:hypothetical protein